MPTQDPALIDATPPTLLLVEGSTGSLDALDEALSDRGAFVERADADTWIDSLVVMAPELVVLGGVELLQTGTLDDDPPMIIALHGPEGPAADLPGVAQLKASSAPEGMAKTLYDLAARAALGEVFPPPEGDESADRGPLGSDGPNGDDEGTAADSNDTVELGTGVLVTEEEVQEETPAGAIQGLRGLDVLVIDADLDLADRIADALEAGGARVTLGQPDGEGMERASQFDPEVVLVDEDCEAGTLESIADELWKRPRLRWAWLIQAPLKALAAGEAWDPSLQEQLRKRLAPKQKLREELGLGGPWNLDLLKVGPGRLLRALGVTGRTLHVVIKSEGRAKVEIDLSEELLVGAVAEADPSYSSRGRCESYEAVALALGLSAGRVRIVERERPEVANIMAPVDEALASASAEAEHEVPDPPPPYAATTELLSAQPTSEVLASGAEARPEPAPLPASSAPPADSAPPPPAGSVPPPDVSALAGAMRRERPGAQPSRRGGRAAMPTEAKPKPMRTRDIVSIGVAIVAFALTVVNLARDHQSSPPPSDESQPVELNLQLEAPTLDGESSPQMTTQLKRAEQALKERRLEEAERVYREVLVREPEQGAALAGLAHTLLLKDAKDEALALAEKAISVAPSADSYVILGDIHQTSQRRKAAVAAWLKALSLNPEHPAAQARIRADKAAP